jgi:hypothetical protein
VTGADRVERNPLLGGDLDDALDLAARGGSQHGEEAPALAGRRERGIRRLGGENAGLAKKPTPRV